MPKYKIADFLVELEPLYDLTAKRAEKYKVETDKPTDFSISLKQEHLEKYKLENPDIPSEMIEYNLLGSRFTSNLLMREAYVLHSSAVVLDDEAYLFSATSGTGKSTHTSRWLNYFGDTRTYIINDDKPALRYIDGKFYVYGTPFSGKHDISVNKCVPLKAIYMLSRAETNSVTPAIPKTAISFLLKEIMRTHKERSIALELDLLIKTLNEVPVFDFKCNISDEAVETSYNAVKGV